jgi:hypothetical protein
MPAAFIARRDDFDDCDRLVVTVHHNSVRLRSVNFFLQPSRNEASLGQFRSERSATSPLGPAPFMRRPSLKCKHIRHHHRCVLLDKSKHTLGQKAGVQCIAYRARPALMKVMKVT